MGGGKGGERRHAVIAAAYEPFTEIGRHGAGVAFSLNVNLLHASAIDKVVHVGAAPGAGERVGDIAQRQSQGNGFVIVDIDLQLRHLRQVVGADRLEFRTLTGGRQQLAAHFHQAIAIGTAAGHQLKGKAVALPQAVHRRWGHGKQRGVANAAQILGGAQGNRLGGVLGAFTFGPVFQRHEGHPGVLSAAAEVKAIDGENNVGIGFFFAEEPVGHLATYFGGTHGGGTRREGVLDHDFALILYRQEAPRQLPHRQRHGAANQHKGAHHHGRTA